MDKNRKKIESIVTGVISFLKSQDLLDHLNELISMLTKKSQELSSSVRIYTKRALTNSEIKKVKQLVSKNIGVKSDNFTFYVEPSILDGMVIKYKDKKWDLSLLNKLQKLKENIYE